MNSQNVNKQFVRAFHLSHSTSRGRKGSERGGVPAGLGTHREQQAGGTADSLPASEKGVHK